MHPGQPAQTLRHENISEIQTSQDLMRRWRGHPSRDVGLHTHGWSCRCCGTGCDRQPGPTGAGGAPAATTPTERRPPRMPRQQDRERRASQEDRGEEIATRADPPAAPGAHRVSGAARRPSNARMRGRGRTGCPPRLPCPHAVRRCRPDRRTDRTMRAAWPGNTAPGATRPTGGIHHEFQRCPAGDLAAFGSAASVVSSCSRDTIDK
jgi:hypothetical protein